MANRPATDSDVMAMVFMAAFLQAQLTLPVLVTAGFAIARSFGGHVDRERRVVFDNFVLLYH